MIDFFRTLFRPAPPSGATAKERLRLVLLSDHLSLAPDVVEALKRDLLAVISRYVEIDSDHADVSFEHREREVAMLASIPITGVRERRRPVAVEPAPSNPPPSPPASAPGLGDAEAPETFPAARSRVEPLASIVEPEAKAAVEPLAEVDTVPAVEPAPVAVGASPKLKGATSANAARPRRRRRKKPAPLSKPATQG